MADQWIYCRTSRTILTYASATILTLGTLGNISTCTVLLRKNFRNEASSIFLMFLAAFDCVYLWLAEIFLSTKVVNADECGTFFSDFSNVFVSIVMSTQAMSLYTTAMIALERVICICYPFRVKSIITKKRCFLCVLGVMTCVVSVNISVSFIQPFNSLGNSSTNAGNTSTKAYTDTTEENDVLAQIRGVVRFLVNFAFPFTATVIGNIIIIRRLYALNSITQSTSSAALRNSVTKVVIAITVFYFVTSMPYFAFLTYNNLTGVDGIQTVPEFFMVQIILLHWMFLNHACNIVLYVWTGSAFRAECRQMLEDIKKFVIVQCRAGESRRNQVLPI